MPATNLIPEQIWSEAALHLVFHPGPLLCKFALLFEHAFPERNRKEYELCLPPQVQGMHVW